MLVHTVNKFGLLVTLKLRIYVRLTTSTLKKVNLLASLVQLVSHANKQD